MKKLLLLLLYLVSLNSFGQLNDILPSGKNGLFHSYLMSQCDTIWDNRRAAVEESLVSEDAIYARRDQLYANYLDILGDLPEKTDLNAVIVDTIETDSVYHIEQLYYESLPGHRVTANFYIPDTGTAPYPTVFIACGHYPVAKTYADYQDLAILFARNGIAALIVDPIAQGERYQMVDNSGSLLFDGGSGTTEIELLDVGSILVGRSTVEYELWDNHRGIDYLYSRTDIVDTAKVGCTGHSGGAAQALYLLAFDKRLKVGTVVNGFTNEENLFNNSDGGPQTGSQNLYYEGEKGIEQVDYITMFAPKPYLIIGTDGSVDKIFKLTHTEDVYNEAHRIYDSLGVAEKVSLFGTADAHDYTKQKREAAVRWFRRWLCDDNDTIIEKAQVYRSDATLEVTTKGQVIKEFEDELNVTQLNINLADSMADDRTAFWNDNSEETCISKVSELIKLGSYDDVEVVDSGTIDRDYYTVQRLLIKSGDHVPVPALLFEPKEISDKLPGVVYVDARGKASTAGEGGSMEKHYIDSGKIVLSIDVRGFGETKDNSTYNDSKYKNDEHRNNYISQYAGKTLMGQRVEDIMKAVDVLSENANVDTSAIILVGAARCGPVAMHAANIDTRIDELRIYNSVTTWNTVLANPNTSNYGSHVVPGALKYYDLTDLTDAFAPKPLTIDSEYLTGISKEINTTTTSFNIFPNPGKENITINFSISEPGNIQVNVFDLQGRLVDQPVNSMHNEGDYKITTNVSSLSAGTYIYQMIIDNTSIVTEKVTLLK